jgi:hypothetical protein
MSPDRPQVSSRMPWRQTAAALAFLVTWTSADLAAQSNGPSVAVNTQFDDECASAEARQALGDALFARIPDVQFSTGDDAWLLQWVPVSGQCTLQVTRGATSHSLELPADSDATAIGNAVSRVAWWISSEPVDVVVPQETAEGSAEGSGEVAIPVPAPLPGAEPTTLLQRNYIVSLTPSLHYPPQTEPFEVALSLNVFGSAATRSIGLELALFYNNLRGGGHGVQIASGANLVHDEFEGLQSSGFLNVTDDEFRGLQVSLVNLATSREQRFQGAQIGLGNFAGGDLEGAQSGIVNIVLGRNRGAQFGVANYAGRANFQLGVVNVAGSSDASIGLISVVRDQPFNAQIYYNERGWIGLGVRHGSRYVQNIIEVEFDPTAEEHMTVAYGLGTHFGRKLWGEFDMVQRVQIDTTQETAEDVFRGFIYQVRASIGYSFLRRLSVFGGASLNVAFSDAGRVEGAPAWSNVLYEDDSQDATAPRTTLAWPGFYAGIRF